MAIRVLKIEPLAEAIEITIAGKNCSDVPYVAGKFIGEKGVKVIEAEPPPGMPYSQVLVARGTAANPLSLDRSHTTAC